MLRSFFVSQTGLEMGKKIAMKVLFLPSPFA